MIDMFPTWDASPHLSLRFVLAICLRFVLAICLRFVMAFCLKCPERGTRHPTSPAHKSYFLTP